MLRFHWRKPRGDCCRTTPIRLIRWPGSTTTKKTIGRHGIFSRKSLKTYPNNPSINLHLGMTDAMLNDKSEAKCT